MPDTITVKTPLQVGQGKSFALITILFFLWGFVTALNDILIPYLKRFFDLNYLQAAMVQMMFFGAYFIGSLCYYLLSEYSNKDLIRVIGYKKAMSLGLFIAFLGTLLFTPAGFYRSFGIFLAGSFILGLGLTLLQVAANPYVILIGPAQSAPTRLNLAQGLNSLGTTVAPAIGAGILFGNRLQTGHPLNIGMIEKMYLGLSAVLLLMALLVRVAPLPDIVHDAPAAKTNGALRFPHLVMGVLAIFTYVGAEVSTGSFLISFMRLPRIAGLSEMEASRYVSLYWGGLMIGRFMGAACFSTTLNAWKKWTIMAGLPAICALGLWIFGGPAIAANAAVFLVLNALAFVAGRFLPAPTLALFAVICCISLGLSVFASGAWGGWLLVGTGLFNSIMWSVIFSLALEGLGAYTSQGSSLLVMAILGAAIIPPVQGAIADHVGLQHSILLPACCYLYLSYYGFWSHAKKKRLIPNTLSA